MHKADVPMDTKTRILVSEINHPELDRITVVGYQNSVKNLIPGPNCMMLVVKSAEWMVKENMIDMSMHKRVLENMSELIFPKPVTRSYDRNLIGRSYVMGSVARSHVETFEYATDFTVVVANDASLIPDALLTVREERRPELNDEMVSYLKDTYEGWHVILFCFEGAKLRSFSAKPVFFWYYPDKTEAAWLRFPALDAHDGKAPVLGAPVHTNHHLFASWPEMEGGLTPEYSYLMSDELKSFMPKKIIGAKPSGLFPNGDFGLYRNESSLIDNRRIPDEALLRLGPDGPIKARELIKTH